MALPPNDSPRLMRLVRREIRLRHYSHRAEEAYVGWIRRFIVFHGRRHPRELGASEVAAFLSRLAARGVAASTQNQALSSILFLYGAVLGQRAGVDERRRSRAPSAGVVALSGYIVQPTTYNRVLSPKFSSTVRSNPAFLVQQAGPQKGSWIGRHAVLFGALAGFGGGFLIGYLPGDDGVFDDFTAEFNGRVKPVIDRTYGLSETPEALGYVGEGHVRGKVVIKVLE